MSIKLPDLDNRTYTDLVKEAVASIPGLHPGWTDHNPSNPGIALIELLSWLTEMVLYRTNQIPQRNYEVFLKLLNGTLSSGQMWELPAGQTLETAIRETMKTLRERYRGVSAEDYEYLVAYAWPGSAEATGLAAGVSPNISRNHCLPEYNLEQIGSESVAPGYVTLIIVPEAPKDAPWNSTLDPALASALQTFFKDRKILTTLLHVTAPVYLVVDVSATLYLRDSADEDLVQTSATQALFDYFHPCSGGAEGKGWPFGHAIHASDVYAVLDQVHGIDYVDPVTLTSSDPTRNVMVGPSVTAITLERWELAKVPKGSIHLTMKQRIGGKWVQIS